MTPDAIYTTPGEISHEEREVYYRLARDHYTGRGEIVEIGALLGASSVCLAQGLTDNPRVADKGHRLHVYDKFEVYQHLVDVVFPFHGIAPRAVGETFLDLYLAYTYAYGPMLHVLHGDAHAAKWDGRPIEILFVDCALSAGLYQHIIAEFYPHLIEGALIIDQDFFYQFAPWLPLKAELMAAEIKPLMSVDCAVVARALVANPGAGVSLDLPLTEALSLMERQAIRWPGEIGSLVHIQRAIAMANAGLGEQAKQRMAEIGSWPLNSAARSRYDSAAERILR